MKYFALLLLLTLFGSPLLTHATTGSVAQRLRGFIVLQVQQHGEAWYINPADGLRQYMRDGVAAYGLMRSVGLGITNADLANIPAVGRADEIKLKASVCQTNDLAERVKGYILLQVQAHGEAWYVEPVSCYRVYLKDGDEAYRIMQVLSLGISDADLATIPTAPDLTAATTSTLVESANNLVVAVGQTSSIIDQQKNVWTIVNGVVEKNGSLAGYSANVNQLAYVNQVVWQRNSSNLWWSWNGSSWSGGSGLPSPLVPVPAVVTPTPTPTLTPTSLSNPFSGNKPLYKEGWSNAQEQADDWRVSRSSDAAKMQYLADQPTAAWFGDWNDDIQADVDAYVDDAEAANNIPVLVAYNIPNRDCGDGYSAGGVSGASAYHDWIVDMANGIGNRQAIVIIEPDAVATDCFDDARGVMMSDAVSVLEAKPNVSSYIDAGHPNWTPAATMATRLTKAGIAKAQGFALNVSNFYTTESNIEFGNDISARVGGKHYVIDTGRNHNGWNGEWCNDQAAGIGLKPTTNTGVPLFDAGLWVKSAGGSDGNCHGGPDAGHWWAEYALDLYNQGTH
ncbi:MAG: glycoside hydrolase family 6 protein [Patescibacteria group bacterium]